MRVTYGTSVMYGRLLIFNPRYTRDTANINEHHNVYILKIMGCYVRDNEIRQKLPSYINSSTDPKC